MSRIYVTARMDDATLEELRTQHVVTYECWKETGVFPTGAPLIALLNGGAYEIYVNEGDQVPAAVVAELRSTRLICVARAAPTNVDIDAATEAGILVTNTPGRNAVAVAEYTVGLILNLARHITQSNRLVLNDGWAFERFEEVEGIELEGRTLGLIGVGHVGREVARRMAAFDMRVLGYDPYVLPELARSVGVELVQLTYLLSESDVVSIHASVTPETIGLIGAGELALLKPTALLVNTARASLTDEQALYEVLRERRIDGAALDVFLQEPLTASHPLARLDNVLATPHLAGATREVVTKHSRVIARNIQAYASRLPLPNLVNPEALGPLAQTDHG